MERYFVTWRILMVKKRWMLVQLLSVLFLSFGYAHAVDMAPGSSETDYLVGPGDVLMISIWKDESLTQEVLVLPDGTISFPLVGLIKAEDKTISELKAEIEKRIAKYVPEPVLWVSVKNINSAYIYVLGRVHNPGRFTLNSRVSVLQALAIAGGLTPFADKNDITIFRTELGKTNLIRFRYDDVIEGEHTEDNIILKRGDVIIVP
ncbi:MAG TPA: polysaccharide biosynthesis/export family protein [Deltaproteobacteria bacterium]|nr:polysaccharide biosynthesis/export family protein [Deltaproteobacteria bacterium]HPP81825.1 polysaccharide biosynthesis/export family protein [Deltaproteobacteria bacterium]